MDVLGALPEEIELVLETRFGSKILTMSIYHLDA